MFADKNIKIFGITGYREDAGGVRQVELPAEGHVDEKGREYPCCEFEYDEEGFEEEIKKES